MGWRQLSLQRADAAQGRLTPGDPRLNVIVSPWRRGEYVCNRLAAGPFLDNGLRQTIVWFEAQAEGVAPRAGANRDGLQPTA